MQQLSYGRAYQYPRVAVFIMIMQLVVFVYCLALLQNKPKANYAVAEMVMIPLFMIEDFGGGNCGQKQCCSMAP